MSAATVSGHLLAGTWETISTFRMDAFKTDKNEDGLPGNDLKWCSSGFMEFRDQEVTKGWKK